MVSGVDEEESGSSSSWSFPSAPTGTDGRRIRHGGGDNDARTGISDELSLDSGRGDVHAGGGVGGDDERNKKLGSFCIVVMGFPTRRRVCTEDKESSV